MTTLTANGTRFRINLENLPLFKKEELTSVLDSLSEWIDYNEEYMTEKQFNRAMEIKNKIQSFANRLDAREGEFV